MATLEFNFAHTRGDTLAFALNCIDIDQDLDAAYFTAREGYDGNILFQKSLGNGITKVQEGIYSVRVAPSDTENAEIGSYFYDLEIGINGDVFTLMKGTMKLEYDVTRRT